METYQKHIYDVDIIKTYLDIEFELTKKENESTQTIRLLTQLKDQINYLLDERKLDKSLVWSHKLPIIILPEIDIELYTNWLGLFLFGINPNKVHLILEYHFQNMNSGESFLNRVEFLCLERLNENKILSKGPNGELIATWLLRKREMLGYDKSTSDLENTESTPNQIPTVLSKKIVFSPQRIEAISTVVFYSLFEQNENNRLLVQQLIEGKTINTALQIKYTTSKFTDLFVRLKKEEIIFNQLNKDVASWISENFHFLDLRKKTFKGSTIKTILKTFSGERSPSEKDKIDISSIINNKGKPGVNSGVT